MTATDRTPGVAPDGPMAPFREQLLQVLRGAGCPLTTAEIRQQLGLADDKRTTHRLCHELNRLYTTRRVEVDRHADPTGRQNMWRAVGTPDGAR